MTVQPITLREPPTLWIIGGANGSGKSTAYDRLGMEEASGSVWIINPDLLTARIRDQEGLDQAAANLASVQRIENWLYASVATHQTVGVETVLSTDKYRKLVRAAKKRGFQFKLIYLVLASAALNVERVRARVAMGRPRCSCSKDHCPASVFALPIAVVHSPRRLRSRARQLVAYPH